MNGPPGTKATPERGNATGVESEVVRLVGGSTSTPEIGQGASRQKRRITVADHQRFRETGMPPHADDIDLDVELLDRPRQRRSNAEVGRVLGILDELEGGST